MDESMREKTTKKLRLPAVLAVVVLTSAAATGCGGSTPPPVDAQVADAGLDAGCQPFEMYDPVTMTCMPLA